MPNDDGAGGKPIGYRSPPVTGRFRKGQSGNPKGRPRKPRTTTEALNNAMARGVNLAVDGRRKKVAAREALALKLVQMALGSDQKTSLAVARLSMEGEAEQRRQAQKAAPSRQKQEEQDSEKQQQLTKLVVDLYDIAKIFVAFEGFVMLKNGDVRVAMWLFDLLISHRPDLAPRNLEKGWERYLTDELPGSGRMLEI